VENKIIDYVGGQDDLAAKRLRAIGNADARLAEDHLRMLRAIRFASRLGFEIDPATAAAIQSHAKELIRISPERIAEELRKMLVPVTRNRAYRLLGEFGFIPILMRFLPEGSPGGGVQPAELFPKVASGEPITFGLALAALTLQFRMNTRPAQIWLTGPEIKRAVHAMRQSLKISNDEAGEMAWSISFIQLLNEKPPTVAMLKRFLNQPHSSDATALMTALGETGVMREKIAEVLRSLDHWRQTEYAPTPLITGDDLAAAGAAPGPKFKIALDSTYDAQLEGRIATKDQALEMAMNAIRG